MRARPGVLKERGVINRDDFPFTFVPQRDRRQQPDRRTAWRGSRRAADQALASLLCAHNSSPMMWTPPLNEAGRGGEKRILH